MHMANTTPPSSFAQAVEDKSAEGRPEACGLSLEERTTIRGPGGSGIGLTPLPPAACSEPAEVADRRHEA
jgi:hypothetical protein